MDDSNQIDVPASFIALFTAPSGRLTETVEGVRQRYEVCEDLAQLLAQQLAHVQSATGRVQASELLAPIRLGLAEVQPPVPTEQAEWVVRRVAELLQG